jgi:hypothetical protein
MGGNLSCEDGPFTGVSYRCEDDFNAKEAEAVREAETFFDNFVRPPDFPALWNGCVKYLGFPDFHMDDLTKYWRSKRHYNRYFICPSVGELSVDELLFDKITIDELSFD